MRAAGLLLVAGCARPISNAAFYEDAAFVRAVPSSADLALPEGIIDAPSGGSSILTAATAAATAYETLTAPIAACGDALRATAPDLRTDDSRGWAALTLAWSDADGVHVGWAEVVAVRDDGLLEAEIAVADTPEGPYVPRGRAYALADGTGHLDLAADDGSVAVDWLAGDAPSVDVATGDGALATAAFAVHDGAFAFTGAFALTEDGATWPGRATVTHGDDGGHAAGEVVTLDGPLAFEACWGPDGATAWQGGDPGITTFGASSACPTP